MTHFVKSPLNFLTESLESLTCDVINGEGVVSPALGATGGGVNAVSVGGGEPGVSSPVSVEGGGELPLQSMCELTNNLRSRVSCEINHHWQRWHQSPCDYWHVRVLDQYP